MAKLISTLVIIMISAGIGIMATERHKLRLRMLSGLTADFSTIRTRLRYERVSIGIIVADLSTSSVVLREFWGLMLEALQRESSLYDAWLECRAKLGMLNADELLLLDNFCERFGSCDVETELIRLNSICEKLLEAESTLKSEYQNKAKLSRTLSLLGGIACALMVL